MPLVIALETAVAQGIPLGDIPYAQAGISLYSPPLVKVQIHYLSESIVSHEPNQWANEAPCAPANERPGMMGSAVLR